MIRLYDFLPSGNGYKIRLLLHQLAIPYELVQMDITRGETRTPEFLAKNPNGRIPLIELEDGRLLAESGAILFYFAEGTRFLPADRWERVQVLQWMFFEQYSHEPYVAVARAWLHLFGMDEERKRQLPQKQKLGYDALGVMERHLREREYFVGERPVDRRHRAVRVYARRGRRRLRARSISRRAPLARADSFAAGPGSDHLAVIGGITLGGCGNRSAGSGR